MKPADQSRTSTVTQVNGTLCNGENGQRLKKNDKIAEIAHHFGRIMEVLGLDLDDPSLKDTPARVAKMFVNEAFVGLDETQFPEVSFLTIPTTLTKWWLSTTLVCIPIASTTLCPFSER